MPNTFYGPHAEKYNDYAFENNANRGKWPMGHILILPDHREYRFALNDGTAEVAGNLYQSVAPVVGHTNIAVDTPRAIGVAIISATLNGTAPAADIYAEGTVHVNDSVGEGYAYRITRAYTAGNAHASAGSAAVMTVNLFPGDSVQVALTTVSEVTFTRNRYHQVLIHPGPPTAGLAGVSPGVAAADRFYWSQVKGYAAVLVGSGGTGVVLAGLPVMAGITTDGTIEGMKRRMQIATTGSVLSAAYNMAALVVDQDGNNTALAVAVSVSTSTVFDISGGIANNAPPVGICIKANVTTEYALVDLRIA